MIFKIIGAFNSYMSKLRYSLMFPSTGMFGKAFRFAEKEHEVFSKLVNYPSEENAKEYIELHSNRPNFTLSPQNNPNSWAVLREKWQIINHSDKIPTHLKKEILDILMKKGLYLNNSKVIDNYEKSEN